MMSETTPRKRNRAVPIAEFEQVVLEDAEVVWRGDRHIGCCGHPCALAGVNHEDNRVCCMCERCLLTCLRAQLPCDKICRICNMMCDSGTGRLVNSRARRTVWSHNKGEHFTAEKVVKLLQCKHSTKVHSCDIRRYRANCCNKRFLCGHECIAAQSPQHSATTDHTLVCVQCRTESLEWLFGEGASQRSRLLQQLPLDVLRIVLAMCDQPYCTGCVLVVGGNQLRPVASPEDLGSGWNGPYCYTGGVARCAAWWAPAALGSPCVWRWLPPWAVRHLAQRGFTPSRLRDTGAILALLCKLNYRVTNSAPSS